MNILVTGGAGYIGSITTRVLLDAGHAVTVLDSLEHGHREAVDERARFVEGSVGDRAAVRDALEGIDAVLHCAGLIEVGESEKEPARYWSANVAEPLVMLEMMAEFGIQALVFSSTAAVYGEPDSVPIPETALTAPINTYGETKLAFERMIESFARAHGLRSVRLRYFNVAGAWPDGSLGEAHVPETHILPRILGSLAQGTDRFEVFGGDYPTRDGSCVRDYIHVCDLAKAHMLALEYAYSDDRFDAHSAVFNLGSGEGFTNLEVVKACAEVTGREVEVVIGDRRPGDPASLVASSERAREVLGWSPERTDLPTMIADAWRWHQTHPEGYRSA